MLSGRSWSTSVTPFVAFIFALGALHDAAGGTWLRGEMIARIIELPQMPK